MAFFIMCREKSVDCGEKETKERKKAILLVAKAINQHKVVGLTL